MSGFIKKKKYGQNFLTSDRIPARIAAESGITSECGVIEIGPGLGVLTKQLLAVAKKVVAIEIDTELIPILTEKFADEENFRLINEDVLNVDLDKLIAEHFPDMPVCVCANLPYYITTPILMKLLEGKHGFITITVMVQKEVAQRLCSKCGDSEYGAITASVNYYASVKRLFPVKAGSFSPPPKVDSAVIRFDLYDTPPVAPVDENTFFAVIRAAFAQRRKTLLNALCTAFSDRLSRDELAAIITEAGLTQDVRGEKTDNKTLCFISDKIFFNINGGNQK
ncbi:MAG: ribosomal RNA small subunit methyltransferase A [Clostridia bacterium]|nr:ribosomal RNA small subunit methyltransferase A [Clostridia bacterium]